MKFTRNNCDSTRWRDSGELLSETEEEPQQADVQITVLESDESEDDFEYSESEDSDEEDDNVVNENSKRKGSALDQPDVKKTRLGCEICLDDLTGPVEIGCGHIYCSVCINRWMLRNAVCPHCKSFLDAGNFRNLFICETE